MHKIYHDVFKNTPVEDLKLTLGTRNRQDARNELIHKRPSRVLSQNKPRKVSDSDLRDDVESCSYHFPY